MASLDTGIPPLLPHHQHQHQHHPNAASPRTDNAEGALADAVELFKLAHTPARAEDRWKGTSQHQFQRRRKKERTKERKKERTKEGSMHATDQTPGQAGLAARRSSSA